MPTHAAKIASVSMSFLLAGLTGCSHEDPKPPPQLVVDATIRGQHMTITGWSQCWVSSDTGNTLITADDGDGTRGAWLMGAVKKGTDEIDSLEIHDKTKTIQYGTNGVAQPTATKNGRTMHIVTPTGDVDITLTCPS
jgi:hypothetical protein